MKRNSVKIRAAAPKDSGLLAPMNHRLIRDSGHRNPMNIDQLTRRMRRWLKGEYKGCVFEMDGKTVGYCVYRKEEDFLYVRQLYIERAYRRKGLGLEVVKIMRKTIWKNYPLLRMDVLVRNRPGVHFWRAAGFKDYCLTLESVN